MTASGPATEERRDVVGGRVSVASLQTSVGIFQTVVGAMMLVVPHQFSSPGFALIQPHLSLWGIAFLLFGAALLAVALLRPPAPFRLAAHLLGGAALVMLAYGVATVGAWTGTINLGTLGLGTALAFFLVRPSRRPATGGPDLLVLVVGFASFLVGAAILLLPGQFGSPLFDPVRPYLPLLGAAFLVAGLLLVTVNLWPGSSPAARWAGHLLLGATYIAYFTADVPLRAGLGMVYYGGFGIAIALLPWLKPRLDAVDSASLRVRLALGLAFVAVVPVLFTLSLALHRQEEATTQLALGQQERLASAVARDVADYVGLHRAAVVALAAQPGLLDQPPEAQHASLKAFISAYPEVYVILIRDPAGNPIAQSGDLPLPSVAGEPAFERLKQANRTQVIAQFLPTIHQTGLSIATPVVGQGGQAKGYVASAIVLTAVSEAVARAVSSGGANAYLVDDQGRVIAHPDSALAAAFADLSLQPPVAAMLAREQGSGSLQYGPAASEQLAGYARVADLGWGVVVEEPRAQVLAETRAQRDLAFVVLILAALAAAGLGFVLADSLVKPLDRLVLVVGEIASGNRHIELPEPQVSEVRQLTKAVGAMNAQLTATEAERKRVEEEVRAGRERLRVMLTSIGDGVIATDGAGRITFLNPVAAALTGWTPEDALGQPIQRVFPILNEKTRQAADDIAARALREKRVIALANHTALVTRDGREIPIEDSAAPILDAAGNVLGMVLVFHDVTQKRRAHAALRVSEERYRSLAEAIPQLIWVADAAGRTEYLSPRWVEYIGREVGTVEGRVQFVHPEDRPGVMERWQEATRTGGMFESEHRLRRHDGEYRWVLSRAFPIRDAGGRVVRWLGTVTDIHDLKQAEAERERLLAAEQEAREQAEQAVQVRDEFLSVAAHELKTPVTSLRGFAQVLLRQQEQRGTVDPEHLSRALRVMDQQSSKLARLVSHLLDVSQIEGGQLAIDRQSVNLVEIVEGVVNAARLQTTRHTLTVDAPPSAEVCADPLRIEQVITNLVDNAIRYSPAGGLIEIRVAVPDGRVEVAVCDHGLGIAPEHRPHIFERFYQAHQGGHIAGLGLGLYLSQQVVALHGGRIEFDSPPDGGTRFVVVLPGDNSASETDSHGKAT